MAGTVRCRMAANGPVRDLGLTTPGHAGLQDWGQDIDPMGKSWEIDAEGAGVS
jgi:hypothetical protein